MHSAFGSRAVSIAAVFIISMAHLVAHAQVFSDGFEATAPGGSDTSAQSVRVDALMRSAIDEDSPGATVAVLLNNRVVHKAAYGLAELDDETPLSPDSIMHFGSAGKQFTGLAIMILAERGLIDYDDPVADYLSEVARFGRRVTIRTLLQHTSGLPTYTDEFQNALEDGNALPTNADLLALIARFGRARSQAGEKFEYSNVGYELAGSIVERVSGKTFRAFMDDNVFAPLGMTNAFSQPAPDRLNNNPLLTRSYDRDGGQIVPIDDDALDLMVGSGSVYLSLEDAILYDRALRGDTLVKQKTLAEATEYTELTGGDTNNYGFGWTLGEFDGSRWAAHEGSWLAYNSSYLHFIDRELSVIVLFNRDYDLPGSHSEGDSDFPEEDARISLTIAKYYLDNP